MAKIQYFDKMREIITHLETIEEDNIERAAETISSSLLNGGVLFTSSIGHGNHEDFLNRAGGLAAVQYFAASVKIESNVPDVYKGRPRKEDFDKLSAEIEFLLKDSEMRSGDVLLIGSVSGKNAHPIELAMQAKKMGVKVIAFTSLKYTAEVKSGHPSGKKLCDVADVVVDNGAPFGDAAVSVPGYDFDLLPVSGASAIISGWAIFERTLVKMHEAGKPATVFMSINRPGGQDFYNEAVKEYNKRGY